ncbi:subtilisin-like protein, partial [Cryphonectria parasitica EP155]
GSLTAPPDHGWIESMEMFRRALMTLHETLPKENRPGRVKVALIDDGVDRADLTTYQNRVEVTGMSYWSPSMGTTFQNPSWHQSTHGHGTIMANSIIRINPWVSLYAMRIQDDVDIGPRNEVSIRIHAGSAAGAIEDAIILKVDIISISWTIRNLVAQDARAVNGQEEKAIKSLKKAIENAKEHGILIFCSASDDVKKKGAGTLPYSQAREYIFRIGAADAYGWSHKATEDQQTIDYFLPGYQVADDFHPRIVRTEELKYRDGSSVATALAAGLASLVLYLTNLMKMYYCTDTKNMSKFSKYGDLLRTRDGLKKAFENMITDDNYKDKKFLPVWDLFGSRAKEILNNIKDPGAKWDLLDELCRKLAT